MLDSIVRSEPVGFAALLAVIALLALAIALGVARYAQSRRQNRLAIAQLKREWTAENRRATATPEWTEDGE